MFFRGSRLECSFWSNKILTPILKDNIVLYCFGLVYTFEALQLVWLKGKINMVIQV